MHATRFEHLVGMEEALRGPREVLHTDPDRVSLVGLAWKCGVDQHRQADRARLALVGEHTQGGTPIEQVRKDTERDRFMNAEQSKEYGLIDEVVSSRGAE